MTKWKWSLNTDLENRILPLIRSFYMMLCKSFKYSFCAVKYSTVCEVQYHTNYNNCNSFIFCISLNYFFEILEQNSTKITILSQKRIVSHTANNVINPLPMRYLRKILNNIQVSKIHLIWTIIWDFPCGPYAFSDLDRTYTQEK